MAAGYGRFLLLALCLCSAMVPFRVLADDGGMCTMETKKTCADDAEEEPESRYTENANTPAEEGSEGQDVANSLPMSTLSDRPSPPAEQTKPAPYWEGSTHLHIACVICGDRTPEALVMMKSGVVFSSSPLTFHIFTEDHLHKDFSKELDTWQDVIDARVTYKFYPVAYPKTEDTKTWRENFKPCATMRLFIPTTTEIESVIYMDTDILFLSPVERIWKHFSRFNDTQLAAVAPESEDLVNGWYPRFARHPFYGQAGINSGVMLMNMTRIRAVNGGTWQKELIEIFHEYRHNISWGDQCLLNIYFYRHPELVRSYSCEWNYRPDHCMYGVNNCQLSNSKTPQILHGNRRAFHDQPRQPFFKAVYDEFVSLPAVNKVDGAAMARRMDKDFKSISKDRCMLARSFLLLSIRQSARSVSSRVVRLRSEKAAAAEKAKL